MDAPPQASPAWRKDISDALDRGDPLSAKQFRQLLNVQAEAQEGQLHDDIAALNVDGAPPRAVHGAQLQSVLHGSLAAELYASGRKSMLVVMTGAQKQYKKKRSKLSRAAAGDGTAWSSGSGGR